MQIIIGLNNENSELKCWINRDHGASQSLLPCRLLILKEANPFSAHPIFFSLPSYTTSCFLLPSAGIKGVCLPSTGNKDMRSQVLGWKVCSNAACSPWLTSDWLCTLFSRKSLFVRKQIKYHHRYSYLGYNQQLSNWTYHCLRWGKSWLVLKIVNKWRRAYNYIATY